MKIKSVIGIILIILSIIGMYFWENGIRDRLILSDVIVAAKDICAGEIIDENSIKILSVKSDGLVDGCISPKDAEGIIGQVCLKDVKTNVQLSDDLILPMEKIEAEGSFTMTIPSEWIYLKNKELSAGDIISIYIMPEKQYLGSYKVKMTDEENDAFIEIQCMLEDYFSIYDKVISYMQSKAYGEKSSACLLLVSGRTI